uniref:Uncharacterized protein n=1 Tax=Arundo donax TaxID=35708 RepID=A0A0A9C4C9_ARUDO
MPFSSPILRPFSLPTL